MKMIAINITGVARGFTCTPRAEKNFLDVIYRKNFSVQILGRTRVNF